MWIIGFAIARRNHTARLGMPLVLEQLRWSMPGWRGTALTETYMPSGVQMSSKEKSETQRTWLGVPICCIWLVPNCPIVTAVGLPENASRYMAMGNPSKNGLLSMWMFGLSSCIVSRGPGVGPVSGRPLAAIIVHCHLGLPASESQCWAQLTDLFDCRQRAPIQAQNLVTCSFYKILETPDSPLFRLCHLHLSSLSVT
jgi:hypothetical protein